MGYKLSNWTQELCNTLGTGDIFLAGVISTNQTRFRDGLAQGEVKYSILDGASREVGVGVFNGTNQIVRSVIHATLVDGFYNDQNPGPLHLSGQAIVSGTLDFDEYKLIVDTLETHGTLIQGNIDSIEIIETGLEKNTNQINSNTARITTNEADILELQINQPEDSAQIEVNRVDIAAHEIRITDNEANIATNAENMSTFSGDIDSLENDVKFRETAISAMSTCNGVVQEGTTSVRVSIGTGELIDSYTDPDNQIATKLTWPETTFNLLTNGGMPTTTGLGITEIGIELGPTPGVGVVKAYPNGMSSVQRRTEIRLAVVEYDNQAITAVLFNPIVSNQVGNTFIDYIDFVEPGDRTRGLVIRGTTIGDLSLWRDSGSIFSIGSNYSNNKADPNVRLISPFGSETSNLTASLVMYNNGATSVGATVATVPNDAYEPEGLGVLDTLPVGDAVIHYIYESLGNRFFIQYGQVTYPTYDDAVSNLFSDRASMDIPIEFSNMSMLGQMVVDKGAIAGWDEITARVFPVDSSSGSGGGGGGGASNAIDVAYADTYGVGANVQAAIDSLSGVMLSNSEHDAVDGAAAPSAANVFATMQDITDAPVPHAQVVPVTVSTFFGHLSSADDTVQKALITLDTSHSTGAEVSLDTTNFNGNFTSADNTVQKAIDTMDEIIGAGLPSASQVNVDAAGFAGNLGVADTDVQKALVTIDEMLIGDTPAGTEIILNTTGFNKRLSATDSTAQKAFDTLDDYADQVAGTVGVSVSNFNGLLSSLDTTVQKALDTIDNIQGITIPPHNDLVGLQGGAANDMYHVIREDYDAIRYANAPASNNVFATMADIPAIGGAVYPGENYIINGSFYRWQRATSASGNDGEYVSVDRWKISSTYAAGTVLLNQVETPTRDLLRVSCTNPGSETIGINQVIEAGYELASEEITISFYWVPVSSLASARIEVYYGSGGIPESYLIPDAAVEERKIIKITAPVTSGNQWYLRLKILGVGINVEFQVADVALVLGHEVSGAFPHETEAKVTDDCLRYFQSRIEAGGVMTNGIRNSTYILPLSFVSQMRSTAPVIVCSNFFSEDSSISTGNIVSVKADQDGFRSISTDVSHPSGTHIGFYMDFTADAEI